MSTLNMPFGRWNLMMKISPQCGSTTLSSHGQGHTAWFVDDFEQFWGTSSFIERSSWLSLERQFDYRFKEIIILFSRVAIFGIYYRTRFTKKSVKLNFGKEAIQTFEFYVMPIFQTSLYTVWRFRLWCRSRLISAER